MIIIKILFLQLFWFATVYTNQQYQTIILLVALGTAAINFFIVRSIISRGHYLFTIFIFVLLGTLSDSLWQKLGWVNYDQNSHPLWLTSLYIVFICYYGDVFNYLSRKSNWINSILGGLSGALTYYGGARLADIEVISVNYYLGVGLFWSLFLPLSLRIFYGGFMWNKLLDLSIVFSFDKSGYIRHSRQFDANLDFSGITCGLITGGTSGVGLAAAQKLANHGVLTWVTGRNLQKGFSATELNNNLRFTQLDMADWNNISEATTQLPQLDFVVLNAGGMPNEFTLNSFGIELQYASQLFGHYYLLKELDIQKKLKPHARVVWVSSGGMYLSNIAIDKIQNDENYNKVATYASVKRAQITMLPFFVEEFTSQIINAMHPGWVETPGVASAIPKFNQAMKGKLRTPLQGADTILWLISRAGPSSSGSFYFDRQKVITHFFWFTKKSESLKQNIIQLLKKHSPN